MQFKDVSVIGNNMVDFQRVASTDNDFRLNPNKRKKWNFENSHSEDEECYRCHEALWFLNNTAFQSRLEDVLQQFLNLRERIVDERWQYCPRIKS